ncbi:hypothetical protein HJC99_02185 [Candidatus Saccharibacteria bacterium]|nr:hypothetical protein [Candidatus Saccharibacteria bacterium]
MVTALGRQGIDIGIINYQDMGNWRVFKAGGPTLHLHVLGRAKNATIQKYGDAVYLPHRDSGYYDEFRPLDDGDRDELARDIEHLLKTPKYAHFGAS